LGTVLFYFITFLSWIWINLWKLNCLKTELSSFDARLEMGSGSGCGMHHRHETSWANTVDCPLHGTVVCWSMTKFCFSLLGDMQM
jgi:hypothetical protein